MKRIIAMPVGTSPRVVTGFRPCGQIGPVADLNCNLSPLTWVRIRNRLITDTVISTKVPDDFGKNRFQILDLVCAIRNTPAFAGEYCKRFTSKLVSPRCGPMIANLFIFGVEVDRKKSRTGSTYCLD